jgi:hypothetical protein
MALEYEATRCPLLRGDGEVTVRAMRREDISAVRRYDDELTATLAEYNANLPPGGITNAPGGPWADDQELLGHFRKYAERGDLTLLAVEDTGRVVGFADLWSADEPEPFGRSLDVECIDYFREYYLAGLETILLAEAEKVARGAGLPALDVGTNTCSGEYTSLRRFGLKVFYEYDDVLCRCEEPSADRAGRRMVGPAEADLSGLIRVGHWAPTDFAFRGDEERAYIAELTWPGRRAILELWRYEPGRDDLPVPPHRPNRSELYAEPAALTSPEAMSEILAECAALAGEAGAPLALLACPSEIALDEEKLHVHKRGFAFAWLRKRL